MSDATEFLFVNPKGVTNLVEAPCPCKLTEKKGINLLRVTEDSSLDMSRFCYRLYEPGRNEMDNLGEDR